MRRFVRLAPAILICAFAWAGPLSPTAFAAAPDAPTNVVATRGNAQAGVSWTASVENGGDAVTSYTVTSSPGSFTCDTPDGSTVTCTVTGLTNGTSYTFTVVAHSVPGPSPASLPSNAVTPATVPGAPTGATATRGNASADVSWTAPADNGGSVITGYTATSSPGSFTCTTATASCTVSGLTNGTAYTFTVTATNDVGTGAASDASNSVTPATVPGAPTSATAVRGNASADVSWTAPADNGGSAISSYTATSSPGSFSCTTATTSCTVSTLTNGTSYTFTVTATNAVGMGAASDPSNAVTPATVPGAPTSAVATRGNTQASVSWTAPADNGGSAITGYTVTSSPGSFTCTTASTACTVTGLTNGTAYVFTVTATNSVGTGAASDPSNSVTPATVPGAPTSVVAVRGNASADVSWTSPSNGGSPITGYTVTSNPGGLTCTTATTSCTVGGLTNGTSYTFTVTATNSVGTGAASAPSNAVTPATVPGAPTGATAVRGDTTADVSWTAPADNGGSTITAYTVTSSPGGLTCAWASGPLTCTVTGLTNGTAYTFTVTATNDMGTSAPSAPSNAVTPATVPGAPTGATAVRGNTSADVSWTAPADNGGSAITAYTVTSSPGGLTCAWASGPLTCTVSGLTNGTAYTFTVTATNAVGTGAPSAPSNSVTPATVPGVPTSVVATRGNTQASVSWTAPADNGGSAITGYTVTSNPGSFTCTTAATSCTVTGLTNGTAYTFTVTATNAVGTGAASAPSNSVTPATVPGVPTSVVATRGNTQASVSWTAPADNGGSAITGYTVTSNPGSFTCTTATLTCTVTGLTNGQAYTFTVTATNDVGTGAASAASNSVTPATVPGAPTSATAVRGNTSASVSWTAPASDGGSPITGYTVTSNPGGLTCTTATTGCTVSGLTNGTAYTFTVTATNDVGTGAASAPSNSVTPATVPGAPTSVVATRGNAQASVSWTAPADNGGSAITGYTVTSNPGGLTCATATTGCTVSGLTNGTAYTFTVTATNDVGTGAASAPSNSVTPATVPGAPTSVVATRGNAQASVSWTAPASDGGSPITGYTVTSNPGGLTCATATTGCTVSGLTNGTAYTFTVTATNAVGTGAASAPSNSVTPATVPGAPTSVVATRGNAQATVSWTAPASDGGSPITGYTVTSSPGSFTCTTATTGCTVGGLTNGTAYTFTVTATNDVGTGAASAPSNSVTPATVPGAPTGATAVRGNAQATVSWTAPASNGGSAITGYTVTSNPGSFTCSWTSGPLTCIVTGLTNGTAYTFTVTATNDVGTGAASAASNSVTPATVPDAPTGATATRLNASASVSWTAPAFNGGSAITGYTVTSNPDGKTCTTTVALTCTVTALTNGTAYTFTVTATNSVGTGAASAPSNSVTPATVPGAPTSVVAVRGNQQATVSWTAPASDGGSPIISYTATSFPGSFTCTTATTSCTVTGLTNGTSYTFTVRATNDVGQGAASAASNSVTPATVPGAPTGATAVGGNQLATVSWTAPASNGGAPITSYTVTSSPGSFTCTWTFGPLSCNVTGLTNGTAYTFTVTATNSVGTGDPSAPSNSVTPATLPGAPTGATAVRGNAEATVSWAAPASNGGSPITGYTVTSTPGSFTCTWTTGPLTCTVTGLTNGTSYTFKVTATNSVGTGPASAASNAVIPATVPGAPTGATAVRGNTQATVSWTAPASNGGSAITGYTVTSNPGSFTCSWTSGPLNCIVTGLTNGTAYTFTVTATNDVGTGAASAPSNSVTPATVPGAPTGATAVRGNTEATVSWTAPASDGGSPITGYTVTSNPGAKTCTTTGALTCTVTGLTNGTAYTFTVTATNSVGTGAASAASNSVTPATVPGAPTSVVATRGNTQASVSWTAPASNGGSAITGYTVTSSPGSFTCTSATTTCTVTGLTNGQAYTFTVTATNDVGTGAASAASNSVTPATVPGAPTGAAATRGNASASVSWTAPADNGGSAITGYTVTSNPGGLTCTTAGALTCTVAGLTNGTAYTFTVRATNDVGTGTASAPSNSVTPATVPSAPASVVATRGNTQVDVSWAAPADNGSPITGYTVTSSPGSFTCTTTGALTCTVTGLTNGTAYTFTVTATNDVGTGASSAPSNSVTPATVPGAPTGATATRGNASASVSWTAPADTGGSSITGYTVTSSPGSFTCTSAGTSCTVTGLTNGTAYMFTVVATNDVGSGPASGPSNIVTPATVPGAPTSVVATRGNTQASVSWTAPADNGGSTITGYTVTSSPGGLTCTTTGTSCTVSGLTNGTSYTFTVTATNDVGTGASSVPSNSVTPATVPGAPTSVVATRGNASAGVSWTAPASNGGSPITGYTVTSNPGGLTCTTATLTCTVSGLTNGTAYTFTVTATNDVGTGAASAASNSVTPATVPGAPTSVVATRGNASASVSWTAPAANGSPITGYTVTSNPGGLTCTTASTSCTVSGLTNGTAYTFTVTATNDVGTGAASAASNSVTPATVPGAPTSVVATRGNAQASVSWTAPASNGGSAITGYTVTSSPGSFTCTTTGALTCTVTGLTNGTAYTFTVTATNDVGTGAASSPSNIVTPATVPGAPTSVVATRGNTSAGVSWTAPAFNGGSAITGYTVTSSPGSHTCTTTGALSCTVTGLTNGQAYTFTVTATNDVGTGAASAASNSVIPAAVPGAPTSVTATRGNAQASVSWTAPADDGGSTITGYTVTSNPGSFTCTWTSGPLTCTVTGLTNGTAYTFTVKAANVVGEGPASDPSNSVTPATVPGAPTGATAVRGNTSATVSWTAPASNGGSAITGYTVTSNPGAKTCTWTSGPLTCTVSGLTNGQAYTFTVTATNDVGTGAASAASNSVTPAAVPGAPTSVVATRGNAQASVSWTAPGDDGGSPITGYTVTSNPGGLTCTTASTSCTVTGLTNGTPYTFTVTATNGAGTGPASAASNSVTPATVPGAPTAATATRGNAQATVSWTAPASNGGSAITGYTVTSSPGSFTCTTAGALTCTVSGLTNGTAYTFTVTATNDVGTGAASGASNIVTPATVPGAPISVVATRGNAQAGVSWTAPVSNGGSAITGYTVTSSPGSFTCTTSGTSCTVSGLTNGQAYTFTVTATNDVGTGAASAPSNSVTPATVPGAPTGATAVRGNAQATVSWTAPASNGGSAITGYTVTSNPDGKTCTTTGALTCTVTGLTNGTAYTFTVTATNDVGTGAASAASNSVTPATVPDAPTGATAVRGNAQATVSWTAPAFNGGSPITGYTVTSSPGSFTCTSAGTSCTVTGLTNGTAYIFTVTATNAVGTGAPSWPSNIVTPATVPGAPTSVVATRGNASASVSWTAPASNGGSPISGYTVTSSPGSFTCTTAGTTCTVSGLTNGTAYTFTVVATNDVGSGPASAPSNSVTPATVPGAPTGVVATRGNTQASITWVAPPDNGSPITGYTVTSSPGSHACTTTGALTCTVTGLTNGTAYSFTVVATNSVGNGAASAPSNSVTPATVPGAPTGATATRGNASAGVSWTAPADNGGSAITGYTVTSSPGSFTCTTATTSCTVSGLTNGQAYTFTVRATNDVGQGAASAASNSVTPATVPNAPTGATAVRGNTQATVSWTAPAFNGGSAITGYTVTSNPGGVTCTTAGALTCTVNGLTNGTAYTFTVTATNDVGTGAASAPSNSVTPATVPGAPTSVIATRGNTQAGVSWTAPADNGGSAITGYTVTSNPGSFTCTTAGALTCTVNGLTNGTAYTFTVTATNSVGTGASSAPSNSVIPATVPGAPTSVVATRGNTTASVTWIAPSNNGSPITGYTVTSNPGSFTCTTASLTCTVNGLTNGTAYTFTVTATNDVGTGPSSAPSNSVTPATLPGAPTSVVATRGNASASVSWAAPASNGGSPITGYTVTSSPGGHTCTSATTSCIVSGLTNGASYTFTVTATNDVGTGPSSAASNSVIPATVPAAPTDAIATRGNTQASVSWTSPTDNGGSAITGYTVTSSPGGHTCSWTSGPLTCTVSGLTNGTAYTFTVTATNDVGTGAPSAPSNSVTPATVPGKPTGVTATRGNTSATVSWTAPSNNGSPITNYTVTSSPGSFTCTTATTSCTVSGLTNGSPYTFTVVATNDVGDGATSDPSNSVTPATVPGAPTSVVATRGNTEATVSWTAPADNGGSAVTGYIVTSSPGGLTCSTASTSCTVIGLTNGTAYTFTVVAVNDVGNSAESEPSNSVTPATVPGAPTDVIAGGGNGEAPVSWTAPADNGGSAITSYTVTSSPDGLTCTWSSGPLTCTVTGLTNFTTYTFTVTATNDVGTGAASDPSNSVMPGPFPTEPLSVQAQATNSGARVSWTAPASSGGGTIVSYTVTSSPGGFTCTAATTAGCLVTGLTNGTAYTFTVTATNEAGTGPASSPSAAVTPAAVLRYYGAGRFATAANVSTHTFRANCHCTVYIAYAYNFPDALAGAAAAGTNQGPILLVNTNLPLDPYTAAELTRLHPDKIVVLGRQVISPDVFNALKAYVTNPADVIRYGGAGRFDTAARVGTQTFTAPVDYAYIAYAYNFPDALAGAAAAGTHQGPILLVGTNLPIDSYTAAALTELHPKHIIVLGSSGVISDAVMAALTPYASVDVVRLSGAGRFATAAAVSEATFEPGVRVAYIAYAYNFPDALAGAAAAGTIKGPVLLAATTGALNPDTVAELIRLQPEQIVILGSTGVISNDVMTALAAYAVAP
jgi:titin